uniref:Uncharacterized protein n=1 Tax=Arundo donax TaxID=35708 RepID=A0A0A8ZBW6_ARUDO
MRVVILPLSSSKSPISAIPKTSSSSPRTSTLPP